MTETATCPACSGAASHAYTWTPTELWARQLTPGAQYAYFRCTACSLLFQNPMPDAAEIAAFYPKHYDAYRPPTRTRFSRRERIRLRDQFGYSQLPAADNHRWTDYLKRDKPLHTVPSRVANGQLLDIGCGNGEYLLRMQSIGWQCQGVEFSPDGAETCRAHGLDVFQGTLAEAALPSDRFDLVTAHHFIEHVPDPRQVMAEIVRITRPGGRILIRTPNSNALGRRWFGRHWFANSVPTHVLLFSEQSLQSLARSQGLELVQRYRPVEHKFILKSLDIRGGRPVGKHSKLARWLAKLYIPLARLSGQGDELFHIYRKPA